ncbi:unnamed protein product [Lasius platythorax]|uniref:Uncharacterized protein n=1 Tax=Lasius platythorax TaxID=488582 RepID=A0AAV2NI85_9HYME
MYAVVTGAESTWLLYKRLSESPRMGIKRRGGRGTKPTPNRRTYEEFSRTTAYAQHKTPRLIADNCALAASRCDQQHAHAPIAEYSGGRYGGQKVCNVSFGTRSRDVAVNRFCP